MEGRLFETDEDPDFGRVLQRLRNGKKDLSASRKMHLCSHELCHPETEDHLIRKGDLDGPCISSNVYICIYGTIHICSVSSCTIYHETHNQTCHLSGIKHGTMESSYDKNDSRTWYSKPTSSSGPLPQKKERDPPLKKQKRTIHHHILTDEVVKFKASELVIKLLFSNARSKRNQDAILEHKRDATTARNTYITQRQKQRQLPYLTDVYRLVGHFTSQPLPLMEYEYDESLHDYYVNVIFQVWCLALKYYIPPQLKEYDEKGAEIIPRLDLTDIALGTMYVMRQGLMHGNVVLLPRDEFLLVSLPLIHEMSYFDINKKKITKGNAIITDTYNNAIASGIIPTLDVTQLPEKNGKSLFKKL